MRRHLGITMLLVSAMQAGLHGQPARTVHADPSSFLPATEIDADPDIPTLNPVLGFDWSPEITNHAEVERYLHALAQAAPDRTKLVRYGNSYERRSLHYLVISSPANQKRLDEIRQNNLLLSDPRNITARKASALVKDAPAVVWLAHSVHGNFHCRSG